MLRTAAMFVSSNIWNVTHASMWHSCMCPLIRHFCQIHAVVILLFDSHTSILKILWQFAHLVRSCATKSVLLGTTWTRLLTLYMASRGRTTKQLRGLTSCWFMRTHIALWLLVTGKQRHPTYVVNLIPFINLWARSQNCEMRLLASCQSACRSVRPQRTTWLPLNGFS